MTKDFSAVVLAAGKGTRFKSDKIKVLHPMLGKSMLCLVADCLFGLDPETLCVVVGYQKEDVMKEEFAHPVHFAIQKETLGTADAVLATKELLTGQEEKDVLIMNSDLPLVRTETLRPFLEFHKKEGNSLTFLTGDLEDPTGFGRVISAAEGMIRIVEEKDATPIQRRIKESNLGVYCFKVGALFRFLPKISNKNVKGEYYLTDIIEIMISEGEKCRPFKTENTQEFIGVNDQEEFEMAVEVLRKRRLKSLSEKGVLFHDTRSCRIDLDVRVGEGTIIHPDVTIQGNSAVGLQCHIHPHVRITDSFLGNEVHVHESAVLERCSCGDRSQIGSSLHITDRKIREGQIIGGNALEFSSSHKERTIKHPSDNKNSGGA
jgi:bifunctional UDP-N-acetylglucosamine pyrophosphorylase/glucosamine-1-phosphate N-acetyltransferase